MTRYVCKSCGAESPTGIGYACTIAGPLPAPAADCMSLHYGDTIPGPVNWSDVTLREYAALDLMRIGAEPWLNRYWDSIHEIDLCAGPEPTRLSPSGREWLTRVETRSRGADDSLAIAAARDFLKSLGTLATMGAHRSAREYLAGMTVQS